MAFYAFYGFPLAFLCILTKTGSACPASGTIVFGNGLIDHCHPTEHGHGLITREVVRVLSDIVLR